MKFNRTRCFAHLGAKFFYVILFWGSHSPAIAQIIPDQTLPNNSQVHQNGNRITITGGTVAGSNLFHSFQEFSVLTNTQAIFNNNITIDNIISRVTSGKVSHIDGLIGANGTANLFLINPNGIVFGPNASLNIGGSFFGSTANSINFANGSVFSAKSPQDSALLTVSVPIGLQYGNQAGSVNIQQANLAVSPNQSLALLGGDVRIDGGSLLAPNGQVKLGGITAEGEIKIQTGTFIFPENVQRGNVTLSRGAIVDVRGNGTGNIKINSNNLSLLNGSQLLTGLSFNSLPESSKIGNVSINATGEIQLSDQSLITNIVESDTLGDGGNISILGDLLSLNSGSQIATITQSSGGAGDIKIDANNIQISGFSPTGIFSGILSQSESFNNGSSGNILINAINQNQGNLKLANRGFIASVNNSNNPGGSVEVNVNHLQLESGGQILTLARNQGAAGNITVNATGSVTLTGSSSDFLPSPFENASVYNLGDLPFSLVENPNIEASGAGGIPAVSVQRTPQQIVNGNRSLGSADTQFDYYGFSIGAPNSQAIFDIDGGDGYNGNAGSLDTVLVLFNRDTGDIIATNDDSNPELGGRGSTVVQDSYISTTLDAGNYVIGVGEFNTVPSNLQLLEGDRVDRGDTYTLNVSLQNQVRNLIQIQSQLNSQNYNPNYGGRSGFVSVSQGAGNTGKITINAPQLIMRSGSEITATSFDTGNIQDITINGRLLDVNNSTISNITRGQGNAGSLLINTEQVTLSNLARFNLSNFAQGNTGDIKINADKINLLQGAAIENNTYLQGNAGRIIINANTVNLDGEVKGNHTHIFNLVAGPSAIGNTGGIEINTGTLSLTNGPSINTTTYGQGNAGNININATEKVVLEGAASTGRGSFIWSRVRRAGQGNAGNINITTPILSLTNGPELSNRTEGLGDSGSINIDANAIFLNNSTLTTNVESTATGNGGQLNLNTRQLALKNSARVNASSSGNGNAGQISINATESISLDNSTISTAVTPQGAGVGGSVQIQTGFLTLDNQSVITAETASGQGGNIQLQLKDRLLMRRNSHISATAGTAGAGGDGGNIAINAPIIAGIPGENNDITANAFEGMGGSIELTAEGIFGIEFSNRQTPLSDITASSQFGISGIVTINNPEIHPNAGFVQLPRTLIDPDKLVTRDLCSGGNLAGNRFIITGRGGLPSDPSDPLSNDIIAVEWATANLESNEHIATMPVPVSPPPPEPLIEAQGWTLGAEGQVILTANPTHATPSVSQLTHPGCRQ